MLNFQNIAKSIKNKFKKKEIIPLSIIGAISIFIVFALHLFGTFNFLELKMYFLHLN